MPDSNRVQDIENALSLEERLLRYPQLRDRVMTLLDVVENSSGDVVKADQAEQLLIEELRRFGLDALQTWAERKHSRIETQCDGRSDLTRKTKKNFTGIADSDELS